VEQARDGGAAGGEVVVDLDCFGGFGRVDGDAALVQELEGARVDLELLVQAARQYDGRCAVSQSYPQRSSSRLSSRSTPASPSDHRS
jgi:hypothetical protein